MMLSLCPSLGVFPGSQYLGAHFLGPEGNFLRTKLVSSMSPGYCYSSSVLFKRESPVAAVLSKLRKMKPPRIERIERSTH
jgi:hypothetical protein